MKSDIHQLLVPAEPDRRQVDKPVTEERRGEPRVRKHPRFRVAPFNPRIFATAKDPWLLQHVAAIYHTKVICAARNAEHAAAMRVDSPEAILRFILSGGMHAVMQQEEEDPFGLTCDACKHVELIGMSSDGFLNMKDGGLAFLHPDPHQFHWYFDTGFLLEYELFYVVNRTRDLFRMRLKERMLNKPCGPMLEYSEDEFEEKCPEQYRDYMRLPDGSMKPKTGKSFLFRFPKGIGGGFDRKRLPDAITQEEMAAVEKRLNAEVQPHEVEYLRDYVKNTQRAAQLLGETPLVTNGLKYMEGAGNVAFGVAA